tara:strand:- start:476 stop:649 length:174 start_codon:yes stop_codon:yes gene_type:complete
LTQELNTDSSEQRSHLGDAGLVALVPALRLRPALEALCLIGNPVGDEGVAQSRRLEG